MGTNTRFFSGPEAGYAGLKIKMWDGPKLITESQFSEPDGHGGFRLDLLVEDHGTVANVPTDTAEHAIDMAL